MKKLLHMILFITPLAGAENCPEIFQTEMRQLNTQETYNFCENLAGKTVLIVNTASRCGYTPQFEALEKVYQDLKEDGVVVVGFPSNDFYQERGTEAEAAKVCHSDYGVTFPMMMKSSVKGDGANPVFQQLIAQSGVSPKMEFL